MGHNWVGRVVHRVILLCLHSYDITVENMQTFKLCRHLCREREPSIETIVLNQQIKT